MSPWTDLSGDNDGAGRAWLAAAEVPGSVGGEGKGETAIGAGRDSFATPSCAL